MVRTTPCRHAVSFRQVLPTGSVEPPAATPCRRGDRKIDGAAAWIAAAAALAALIAGVRWGRNAAGGSDLSCYLNEARLLSRFTIHIEQPLALAAPWPRAAWCHFTIR